MSKRPPLTDMEKEIIAEKRSRGVSINTIARILKRSPGAVQWHCLIHGIESPRQMPPRTNFYLFQSVVKRGNTIVRAFTPEEDARLVALDRDGLNYSDIGRALKRPRNSIQARLATLARREERAVAVPTNHPNSSESSP